MELNDSTDPSVKKLKQNIPELTRLARKLKEKSTLRTSNRKVGRRSTNLDLRNTITG